MVARNKNENACDVASWMLCIYIQCSAQCQNSGQLMKIYIKFFNCMYTIWYTCTYGVIGIENDLQTVGMLLKNQFGLIEYMWWSQIYKYYVGTVAGSCNAT